MTELDAGGGATEEPRDLRREYARAMRKLTPKMRMWIRITREMAGQKWGAQAKLGYSKHTVWKWLRDERVKKVLELQAEMAQQDEDLSRERQLREYERVAFANIGEFRDQYGMRKPFAEWTEGMCAAVQEIEFDHAGFVKKVKLHRKAPAQDTLARITGVLVDRTELSLPDAPPPVIHLVRRGGD